MTWILIVGILGSAALALYRRRERRVAVASVVSSQGFSEDAVVAIAGQPAESPVTITLADGKTFQTTAGEATGRLRKTPEGEVSWLKRGSSNLDALVLFVLGSILSVVLFLLTE